MSTHLETRAEHELQPGQGFFWLGKVFLRYIPFCFPHWYKFILILLVTPFALSVINTMIPILRVLLIDDAFIRQDYRHVVVIISAIFMIALVRETNYLIESFVRYNIKMEIFRTLGSKFYNHLMRLSLGYHQSKPVGESKFGSSYSVSIIGII